MVSRLLAVTALGAVLHPDSRYPDFPDLTSSGALTTSLPPLDTLDEALTTVLPPNFSPGSWAEEDPAAAGSPPPAPATVNPFAAQAESDAADRENARVEAAMRAAQQEKAAKAAKKALQTANIGAAIGAALYGTPHSVRAGPPDIRANLQPHDMAQKIRDAAGAPQISKQPFPEGPTMRPYYAEATLPLPMRLEVPDEPYAKMQAQLKMIATQVSNLTAGQPGSGVSVTAGVPSEGLQYVWLPQPDAPMPVDAVMKDSRTPMPTPDFVANGPYGEKFNVPAYAAVVSDNFQEGLKALVKTPDQIQREKTWAGIARDTLSKFFNIASIPAPLHVAGAMDSPVPLASKKGMVNASAGLNASRANGSAISNVTAGPRSKEEAVSTGHAIASKIWSGGSKQSGAGGGGLDGKLSAANGDKPVATAPKKPLSFFEAAKYFAASPEPALLLQVNADGSVINLRKASPKHPQSDEMPLTGVYTDHNPQVDMGIVGWASMPQVDHAFSMRTLGFTLFLLAMFFTIIGLGLLLTYKTAILHPEVKFFSGLKPQHDICRAESTASILQAFNQKPKVRMHVKGKGLDFQLDLGSWLSEGPIESTAPIEEFVRSHCPYRSLTIRQQVTCPSARDLEKRVRAKLEATGYPHPVKVTIPLEQNIRVYRNDQLANFLHNRTTRLLMALSGVGLVFWPISWCKSKTHTAVAHWRLNIDVDRFWAHVGPRIYRGGFRH